MKEKSKNTEGVRHPYITVAFDAGVTSSEEDKDQIDGEISVLQIFNAGASTENAIKTSNYNRIQFEILLDIKTSLNITTVPPVFKRL